MKLFHYLIIILGVVLSCQKPDDVGVDLFNDDKLLIKAIPIDLQASSVKSDTQILLDARKKIFTNDFYLGSYTDPIYGKVESGFYTQLRYSTIAKWDFLKGSIDSVVLVMPYVKDSLVNYGKRNTSIGFDVYYMSSPFDTTKTYRQADYPGFDMQTKFASVDVVPNLKDSLTIREDTITKKVEPQLRLPLDQALFMSKIQNIDPNIKPDSFVTVFNGLFLKPKSGSEYLQGFRPTGKIKVVIYYRDSAQVPMHFDFNAYHESDPSKFMAMPYYHLDNSGSIAEPFVNNTNTADSLMMMQGFVGNDIRLSAAIPTNWNRKLINYAVMDFYIAELPGDNINDYTAIDYVFLQSLDNGVWKDLDEVALAKNEAARTGNYFDYENYFGGYPNKIEIDGVKLYRYRLNVTNHFIKAVRAGKQQLDLRLATLFALESPKRTIFYGTKHSKYSAKLRVVTSDL